MQARRREMFELSLSVPGEAGAVDARVRCPSGRTLVQPCFWGQPHAWRMEGGRERWEPTGPAGWTLRLSPPEEGSHEIEVFRTDPAGGARLVQSLRLDVAPSSARGFARARQGRLVREDGSRVTPIGMNLCWWISPDPTVQMERVMARMAEAGLTWTRLWLTHFGDGFTLEWDAAHPSGHYRGLGRTSLAVAARLDALFAAAERHGIDVQLVLWQHSQLASPSHSAWPENPYNASRGGPCATSADFFTSPEAVRLSDLRLRELVARYGAYASLFAWEIFNEMDLVMDAPLDVVARWCADRARTLRALDAHEHLVTTSQAFPPSLVPPVTAADDLYDLAQCHVYAEDLPDALAREAAALARCGKPAIAAEVGLGPGGELDRAHPDGRHLSDATWAALAGGLAGGAMSWWWELVDERDWYGRQSGAARFVRAVAVDELGAPTDAVRVEGLPGARVVARAGEAGALAWIRAGGEVPRDGAALVVPGLPDGEWLVEQWDTATGAATGVDAVVAGGNLRFPLGTFVNDTAVTVRRPSRP